MRAVARLAAAASTEGDWPTCCPASSSRARRGSSRETASCSRARADHFRFLLDDRARALHTRQLEDRFTQALRQLVGAAATVEIEQGGAGDTPARREEQARDERLEKARAALERDPNVQSLRDRFGAVLQPDSIKPVG